ncbi:hypothetical protein WA026_015021, partial [Henosepilachna vigintioctopunctata]
FGIKPDVSVGGRVGGRQYHVGFDGMRREPCRFILLHRNSRERNSHWSDWPRPRELSPTGMQMFPSQAMLMLDAAAAGPHYSTAKPSRLYGLKRTSDFLLTEFKR